MKNKLIILLTFLILCFSTTLIKAENLAVHFIDVGQGDAILIQLPTQETMLIDAGANDQGPTVAHYLQSLDVDHIDYLLATHPHADHIGGLDYIINNFKIDKIYMPNVSHTTNTFRDVLLAVKNKNKTIKGATAGLEIVSKPEINLKVSLLNPEGKDYDNLNNYSLATKISFRDTSFLLTGDIEKKVEYDLINSNVPLKADLLQIPHHGSDSSSSNLFLYKVKPKYGVISVGQDNPFNHPSSRIVSRLEKHGINIYRTDQQNTIIATSNGQKISFNNTAISKNKKITTNNQTEVKISKVSLSDEIVEITNTSQQQVDISNWKLVSVKGKQTFTFPQNTTLTKGESIFIVSGRGKEAGPQTIVWTGRYIWNNDGDTAKLYNPKGKLIDTY